MDQFGCTMTKNVSENVERFRKDKSLSTHLFLYQYLFIHQPDPAAVTSKLLSSVYDHTFVSISGND